MRVYWCEGVLVYWCTGVMVYWCTGVRVFWCEGVLVYWCAGVVTELKLDLFELFLLAETVKYSYLPQILIV